MKNYLKRAYSLRSKDIHSLVALVQTANVHKPHLYKQCPNHPHQLISIPHYLTHSFASRLLIPGQHYEALHLAREAIRYFNHPKQSLNKIQKNSLERFGQICRENGDLLQRLGWDDGARALACWRIYEILEAFNDIFFFGAVDLNCGSKDLTAVRALGWYMPNRRIELDIWAYENAYPNVSIYEARAFSRIGTLLHELIHAYLGQFACRSCPTYDVNCENANGHNGHGRAFHYIASAMEEASLELFGVRIKVGGAKNLMRNWGEVRYLPSTCDVTEWRWLG